MPSALALPVWTETSKYLALTTFRADGRPVPTTVWFVVNQSELLVVTDENSGKVHRLRRSAHATIAPCDARGRVSESPIDVMAEVAPERTLAAQAMMKRRYRVAAPLVAGVSRAARAVQRKPDQRPVAIRITLTSG